ncbi:MAG: hypothetical protein RMX96_21945 [Nostoc sp. ChiSLP02]|nr:hypothetical protein [Nostoc sp. DedSLP05]MDZ8097302.1 hypothetical protein [Nostoc sp. DedSLP01]MDZ8187498.1 hypothetical protein [Nostoc sp. ChiSLP02]
MISSPIYNRFFGEVIVTLQVSLQGAIVFAIAFPFCSQYLFY